MADVGVPNAGRAGSSALVRLLAASAAFVVLLVATASTSASGGGGWSRRVGPTVRTAYARRCPTDGAGSRSGSGARTATATPRRLSGSERQAHAVALDAGVWEKDASRVESGERRST